MTTEPTDAELKAMWQIHAADIGGIFYYARAVLAKWGQPAQAAEPVAREPLSHAQAKALVLKYGNDPLNLVFQVELAHGIKGGQHG